MTNHTDRQAIDIIPIVHDTQIAADTGASVERLLALYSSCADEYSLLTVFARRSAGAEYALRLWASARGIEVARHDYSTNDRSTVVLTCDTPGGGLISVHL